MKKISFGSFPLTEIPKEDRRCLDRYLIKTFSDNISISDAIRNLSVTKNLLYITPDTLMKSWLGAKSNTHSSDTGDRSSNDIYEQALKRAFYILKEFYKRVKDAAFYREYIYYPIYIEKVEKINIVNAQAVDTLMNYSFLILSNDLTKGLKVDEIRYDENASVNFLLLFVEFFSGPDFNYSLHEFNGRDLEFLVQMYQFIEKSGKEPIAVIQDLYKLLGLIKEADRTRGNVSGNTLGFFKKINLGEKFDKTIGSKISTESLKKYRGLLNHSFANFISRPSSGNGSAYRIAFRSMMELIFKSEDLSGLYYDIDTSASRGERISRIYNANKYHEILTLAGELVEYNKLTCKQVIKDDPMDFDFKIENNERILETNQQVVSQNYQTFFKAYVESISNFITGIIQELESTISTNPTAIQEEQKRLLDTQTLFAEVVAQLADYNQKIVMLPTKISDLQAATSAAAAINAATPVAFEGGIITQTEALKTARALRDSLADARSRVGVLETQKNLIKNEIPILEKLLKNFNVDTILSQARSELSNSIRDKVMATFAHDLTFIYDDGKKFFTVTPIAQGLLDLIDSTNYDPLSINGFNKIVKDAAILQGNMGLAASIFSSLDSDFRIAANDAVQAIEDLFGPMINAYIEKIRSSRDTNLKENQSDLLKRHQIQFARAFNIGSLTESRKNDIINNLRENVFKARYINGVLQNFGKYLKPKNVRDAIEFDNSVSQLHPLIKKLVGGECQYFKSFIINFDTLIQIYQLKNILDTEKFLNGLTHNQPRKLTNPLNRIQVVLEDYFGLKENPVWIVSRQNVYLSMPDNFSLTQTGILSNIPKSEIKEVCHIKASDYWNENNLGKVTKFGNKRVAALEQEVKHLANKISEKETVLSNLGSDKAKKNERDRVLKEIEGMRKQIERKENDMTKLREEDKQNIYKPNAFLFADREADSVELLTQSEKDNLIKNQDEIRSNLLKLNKTDDDEIEKMKTIYDESQKKIKENHPFDLERMVETDEDRYRKEFEEWKRQQRT